MAKQSGRHPACQFQTDKPWLNRQYHEDGTTIKKPDELEKEMENPPNDINSDILDRIHGSMIGMALGDALGAHVEFRPRQYMVANPVTTLKGGGTWGLQKGQFTDDTSMGLCLANSLVARRGYVPYDQLVRYKWWHQDGYMSSTGSCFDIGSATRQSLVEFERRQKEFAKKYKIPLEQLDYLSDPQLLDEFNENCSKTDVAGNGALMRLAPVPLFFYQDPIYAIKCSGHSGEITHGDEKAYDACRYYGALIVAAVNGVTREELLDANFYKKYEKWFDGKPLHQDIMEIAEGSYKKEGGYNKGIRGKGYIVSALQAALWAFWSDKESFEKGALAAVNLGDDTDTTAAIYGQLAGAYYGYKKLPKEWVKQVYAKKFIECLSKWIAYEGERWSLERRTTLTIPSVTDKSSSDAVGTPSSKPKTNSREQPRQTRKQKQGSKSPTMNKTVEMESTPTSKQPSDPKSSFRPRRNTIPDTTSHEQPAFTHPASAKCQEPTAASPQIYFHNALKTSEDVYQWFRSLGNDYATYADIFKEANIDGYWLLNQIDDEKLIKHGVKRKDDRQFILRRLEELKKQCPKQCSTP